MGLFGRVFVEPGYVLPQLLSSAIDCLPHDILVIFGDWSQQNLVVD